MPASLPSPAALRSGAVVEGDYAPSAKLGRYDATLAAMDGCERKTTVTDDR